MSFFKSNAMWVALIAMFIVFSTAILSLAISVAKSSHDREVITRQVSADETRAAAEIPLFPGSDSGSAVVDQFRISTDGIGKKSPADKQSAEQKPDAKTGAATVIAPTIVTGSTDAVVRDSGGVELVYVEYSQRVLYDITVHVGESVPLHFRIVPVAGMSVDIEEIIWTSSDRSVIEVVAGPDGKEAVITCVGRGTALLTVTINGVEGECVVRGRDAG